MDSHDRSKHVANLLGLPLRKSLRPACIPNRDLAWLAERERCFPTSPKDTPGSTQTSKYATLSKSGLLCPPESSKAVTLRKPRDSDRT